MKLEGHGPTPKEMKIIALWNARTPLREIAHEVERDVRYVQKVISDLAAPIPGEWEPGARLGSDRLIAALRQHHPERCEARL